MEDKLETAALNIEELRFNDAGLVPCIVQDADTKSVLMMAWMNAESLRLTVEQRTTWFYSRSRGKLWHKGEESGHTQELVSLSYDCDADTLLALVRPAGAACHTGNYSCFYRSFELPGASAVRDQEGSDSAGRGLTDTLGIRVVEQSSSRVVMELPVQAGVLQPAGFLHGGATITLLESCCSLASWLGCDLEREFSFGSHVDVKHVNAARKGILRGVAELERTEDLDEKGRKEYWHVEARDSEERLISVGTIACRVVGKDYFARRAATKGEE